MAKVRDRFISTRYRLIEVVGRGGMGVVWRARDELLDREVAVKEVRPHLEYEAGQAREAYRRMLREARSAARLNHPGIITVHDVLQVGERPCIVMELIDGRSLDDLIKAGGPLPARQVALIGLRVLEALRAAHRDGITHRDIKPSNVLLAKDRVVLTDFGLAALEGDPLLTGSGLVFGSPAFMAPEQARRFPPTPASDMWSFGATLYTAVEGRPPYTGPDAVAVLAALVTQDPAPTRLAGPLTPVIEGLLRKDPARRLSAEQVAAMLTEIANGPAGAEEVRAPRPAPAAGRPEPLVPPPAPRPEAAHRFHATPSPAPRSPEPPFTAPGPAAVPPAPEPPAPDRQAPDRQAPDRQAVAAPWPSEPPVAAPWPQKAPARRGSAGEQSVPEGMPPPAVPEFTVVRKVLPFLYLPLLVTLLGAFVVGMGVLLNLGQAGSQQALWWAWPICSLISWGYSLNRLSKPHHLRMNSSLIESARGGYTTTIPWDAVEVVTMRDRGLLLHRTAVCVRLAAGSRTVRLRTGRDDWLCLGYVEHLKTTPAELEAALSRFAGPRWHPAPDLTDGLPRK